MAITRKLRTMQIILIVATLLVLGLSFRIYAGGEPSVAEHSDIIWQMIVGLFGILNTVLMGVIVWIINNQSSIFRRLGIVEANEQTRAAVCEERHSGGH